MSGCILETEISRTPIRFQSVTSSSLTRVDTRHNEDSLWLLHAWGCSVIGRNLIIFDGLGAFIGINLGS